MDVAGSCLGHWLPWAGTTCGLAEALPRLLMSSMHTSPSRPRPTAQLFRSNGTSSRCTRSCLERIHRLICSRSLLSSEATASSPGKTVVQRGRGMLTFPTTFFQSKQRVVCLLPACTFNLQLVASLPKTSNGPGFRLEGWLLFWSVTGVGSSHAWAFGKRQTPGGFSKSSAEFTWLTLQARDIGSVQQTVDSSTLLSPVMGPLTVQPRYILTASGSPSASSDVESGTSACG